MASISMQLYPQTMQEFIAHWTQVNAALGASPLLLKGGYTLANFTADRTAIVAAMDAVLPAINTEQGAITLRDQQKAAIKLRLNQFRSALAAFLTDSKYIRMLPTQPALNTNETRFLSPFVDMSAIWNLVNTEVNAGFTPPLILPGTYTKTLFDADVTNLKAAFLAVENAGVGASSARAARDVLLPPALARMKQYRGAVVARLPVGSPLLNNIPKYTFDPGPAAQPVDPSFVWNVALGKIVFTWEASASADVSDYSIRTAPLPAYSTDNETIVGTVPKTTLTFATNVGLTVPGATALFKVYVVTTAGREKGSRVLKVVRP